MATLKKSAVDKMNAYYKRVGYTQKDEEDEDKTSSPRQDTTPSTQQNTTTKHTLKHSAVEKMDAYQKRMKSTTARNATNRDRDDAGVRDRFAQRHPEYTGGEAGEANRARNSEKMFRQAAGTTNYYSETAKQIKALETQFDALDQERADITRTRAGYMRGYGSEQGNGQRDRLKKIDTQIRDLKKQLEDLTPAYDSDTVEGLQKTLENANTALISRWSTSDDFEAYAKERQDALNRQGSALQSLIEYYEQNPSQELQSRLQKAYNQYEKDRTDYNKAVEEYAALADTFNAALNEYNDYVDIAKSDASGLEIAGDVALKGMSSINRGVTYTLALPEKVLGMIFPGARGPLSDVADYAADLDAYHANELADSTYGRGTIVKTAADLGAATVAALPNAILAILSSGTSLAGQGATLATGAANSGLASTIGTSIKAMANNPMYWSSFLQTAGTDFEEAKEGGASDVQALATAIISSGLNAAVEIGGGIETLPEQVRRGGASAVKEWVKSMYDEGKEEVIQDIITGITQKVVYDTDKTLFTGEDPIVDPASLRQDFLMGAGVGGILGGGQIAANSALNAAANRISSNQHTEAGSQYQAAADGEAVNGHKNSAVSVNVEITDDVATSDTRRIRSLISANMNQVKTFVQNALQNKNKQQYLKLSDVDPSLVQALKSQGIDISDYAHVLKDNDIRHIDSSHGSKSNAKYKVTVDDIAGVQNVIDNYDNLYLGYNTKAGNPTIVYEYSDGRRTFYVEEVLEAGGLSSKQMVIVGADSKPSFLKKYKKISSVSDTDVTAQSRTTGQSPLGNHVQDAETTAETQRINTSHPQEGKISGYKPSASTESIPQPAQSYNPNFNQNQGGDTGSPAGRTGTRQAVRKATGYGEYGARAFNQIVEDVGQSPDRVRMEFQSAYEAGLTNLPRERASLISHVQEIAYNAGRQDAIMSMKKATARGTTVWSKGGGLLQNEYTAKLDARVSGTLNGIGKATGTKIIVEAIPAEQNANGYYQDSDGTIHIDVNSTDPVMTVVKHELTHRMQALAPKEYEQFRNYAVQTLSSGLGYGNLSPVESIQRDYLERSSGNVRLSTEEAMDELSANFTEKILTDEDALRSFVEHVTKTEEHHTMGQKFFQAVHEFIDKLKRIFQGDKAKMDAAAQEQYGATISQLERAEQLWKETYTAATKAAQSAKNAPQTMSESAASVKYDLKGESFQEDKYFARQMDRWDDLADGNRVKVGTVQEGSALNRVGLPSAGMYFDVGKIKKAMGKHSDHLTPAVLKGIPDLLNNPIVIAEYKGPNGKVKNTVNVYGNLFAGNTPVVVGIVMHLDRSGRNIINNIRTVHARSNFAKQITDASVLYLNENKKKTRKWFQVCGNLNVPLEGTQFGVIRSIAFDAEAVKAKDGVKFSLKDSAGRELTDEQKEFFKDSKIVDDNGNLLALYHGTTAYGEITKFKKGRSGWLGPGIYLSSRRNDAQKYADAMGAGNGTLYELYANVTNPLIVTSGNPVPEILKAAYGRDSVYAGRAKKQANDPHIITPADIKKLQSKGYDGIRWDFGNSTEVSVFSPEQVKRIDNQLPTSDPDIRFSLKGQSDLMKENAKLKETVDTLREQFKTTTFAQVDKKSLDTFTKKLLKDYSSGADINETRAALDDLYTYIANGENGNSPAWNEVYKRAYEASVNILEGASVVVDDDYRQYKELRDMVRTTGLTISDQDKPDLHNGYQAFRKANMGRIKLVNDGLPVDSFYQKLASTYPKFFDETKYTHSADQLEHIAEVLDSLQPYEVNPYSHNMRESATWLANDIIERFYELPQAKPTFADKANRKLTEQVIKDANKLERLRTQKNERIASIIEKNRQKVKDVTTKERAKRTEAVQKVKEHYQAKETKSSESRKEQVLRAKIVRHANNMSQKLLRPSDKQHIPESLRVPVAALLEAINQESSYELDSSGKRVQRGQGVNVTKRTAAFRALKAKYAAIATQDGGDMVIDPALLGDSAMGFQGDFDRVLDIGDIPMMDMSLEQLNTIWRVLRAVEHSVSTAGKVVSKAKFQGTVEWANAMMDDTITRKSKTGKTLSKIRVDLETPYTYFSHFGDAGHAIYRMLRNAQDQQQLMVNAVQEEVQKIVDPKTARKLERETHSFTTERGDKLTLTTAQIMELYELSKREQAGDHLMKGGIVQPEVKSKHISRGTDAILLSAGDIGNITKVLTNGQAKIADGLQRLMVGLLAEYGNKASMTAYGYKKFTGTDYWPIQSAREAIHSSVEKGGTNTRSIKNIGMAKNVVPNASTALDIGGIFQTFASHAADMTDYAAWLCPMEDANRLYNFQFRDEMNQQTGKTIKGLLDRVGGAGAQRYWSNLMEDIQNGLNFTSDSVFTNMTNKVIGNAKGAAFGANLRVMIQQPTAIMRAAIVLNPVDMAHGLVKGTDRSSGWKKALQYSPIAMRKDMGSFDISNPMTMSEILFDSRTILRKFNDAMGAGAGAMDAVTWGKIWNACEWKVKRENQNLKVGSEEFYKATNEVFTEVIDQSQVVDGVLQRSNTMRSGNALVKQATAFMGEPTMTMNIFLRAVDGVWNETNAKKRGKALKHLGRAGIALAANCVVNALAQSVIDAIRDDDEDKDYWERFKAAFLGEDGDGESPWSKVWNRMLTGNLEDSVNPVQYVPFAKDLWSMIQGYDVTRADADVMGDIIKAFDTFRDSVSGEGKRTLGYAVKNLTQQVGKMFGVSAPNIIRDVWGIVRSAAVETENIPLQYEMEKAIYNIENSGNNSRFIDILYRAYENDQEAYKHIYDDMVANGVDPEKIQTGMESRMKKDQGVEKVSKLKNRYLAPADQTEWDSQMKPVQASGIWDAASEEQRDKLEDRLYALVTGNGETVEKEREYISDGLAYGLDETDYLLYKLALDMADKPSENGEYGSYTNQEKAEAIGNLDLSDGEIAYLWNTDEGYEAYANGIGMEHYVDFKAATSNMTADKDEAGNSISGSKKEKVIDYMNTMGLTQDEYDALLEIAGYKSDDEQKSGFGSSSFGSSSFGSSSFGKSSFGR